MIDAATELSDRSDFSTISRQPSPAPTRPMPLPSAAHASDATCVPWPAGSVPTEPSARLWSWSTSKAMRPAKSGWVTSTPVSITPTSALRPWVTSHAAGKFSLVAHHSYVVPGGEPGIASTNAGSVGARRLIARCSAVTEATFGSARSLSTSSCVLCPRPGRSVTSPICGIWCPARRPPVRAATACGVVATGSLVAAAPSVSTSKRPVGVDAWATGARVAASAMATMSE